MDKSRIRSLKVRRKKHKASSAGASIEAIEHLIDSRVSGLQDQIKVLQSNAITTMVIMGDIQNSVTLAASSTESSKRTLQEFLSNLSQALSNTTEFIGKPVDIPEWVTDRDERVLQDLIDESTERTDALNTYLEGVSSPDIDPEILRRAIDAASNPPFVVDEEEADSFEGDDVVENLSEEFEDFDFETRENTEINRRSRRSRRLRR